MANLTVDDSFDDDDNGIVLKMDTPIHTTEHDFGDPFNSTWEETIELISLTTNLSSIKYSLNIWKIHEQN